MEFECRVGDIVAVTYPENRSGEVEVGEYEGRVKAIQGDRITVHFEYPAHSAGGIIQTDREDVIINLRRYFDETYGEGVFISRPTRKSQIWCGDDSATGQQRTAVDWSHGVGSGNRHVD
jgi:hypothetical protein